MVLQFPPWRHQSYLALVRDWFFPNHTKQDVFSATGSDSPHDMRQRAIDKVNLWMFKAGQLPPAMVATASLTEALLHDEARGNSSATIISESAMQSVYAMAFARFVNAFVDRDVARSHAAGMAKDDSAAESDEEVAAVSASAGKGENSMYAHAATIGMPQRFVDIRHQVTHGNIPSVTLLKKKTEQALEWLWERWWVKNASGNPGLALSELEERARVSRQARELAKRTSALPSEDEPSEGTSHDILMEGASDAASLLPASATSRKRKSTSLEDNNN
jgi:ribosomal biogenesis protein LAS1